MSIPPASRPSLEPGVKHRNENKVRSIRPLIPTESATILPANALVPVAPPSRLKKPAWIRARIPAGPAIERVKGILKRRGLHSVCEEASCPNLGECFSGGTATFMILGDICTRRCPFCDVAHGRPLPIDVQEATKLADAVGELALRFVVITSVDRDDLKDGGAKHFADCTEAIRQASPGTHIEILTPDFRGRLPVALDALAVSPPDVFNHNLETVPSLYKRNRPGADYQHSLNLLQEAGNRMGKPTKSGLMVGIGESDEEIEGVMVDLRNHGVEMLTIGQYLQPSVYHLPVERYVTPETFEDYRTKALKLGFTKVASGPLVRSSYHAEEQAKGTFA